MDKRFWAVIGIIIVVFFGIIIVNNRKASAPDGSNNSTSSKSSNQPTNHVKGENAKNVTLVEYGDFQCPVCGAYEPTVEQVYEKYKADIHFQFRNFPLQQIHQNAFAGARAAEAADKQGKYWEMHDSLYAHQNEWSATSTPLNAFTGYATTLGMDAKKFQADFSSDAVNKAVNADIKEGEKLNISGTPTFYLNGKQLENEQVSDNRAPSIEKFSKLIDEEIAKQATKKQ
jgi:protein-disulfide isomerase